MYNNIKIYRSLTIQIYMIKRKHTNKKLSDLRGMQTISPYISCIHEEFDSSKMHLLNLYI